VGRTSSSDLGEGKAENKEEVKRKGRPCAQETEVMGFSTGEELLTKDVHASDWPQAATNENGCDGHGGCGPLHGGMHATFPSERLSMGENPAN
jgi:hypothetical protein